MPSAACRCRRHGGPAVPGEAQQDGQTAAFLGGELQAAPRDGVGRGQLGDDGGGLGRSQDFLKGPEPFTRPGRVDEDHLCGLILLQGGGIQTAAIQAAWDADPENRLPPAMTSYTLAKHGQGEPRSGGIPGRPFDLMQCGPGQFHRARAESQGEEPSPGGARIGTPLRFHLMQGGTGALEAL